MEYWQVMLVETYTAIRESLKNKYMKCIIAIIVLFLLWSFGIVK